MDMFDENMERHFWRKGMSLKTYYIIRRPDKVCGLFSLFNTHLGHIHYAVKRGYVPVIDMMNYENCYLPMEKIGLENSWEYYFEQPSNTTLEEAYSGKRVILSAASGKILRPTGAVFVNKYKLNKWRRFVKQYIHVKRDVLDDIEKEYNTLVSPQDRVLGVLARGTDYVETKPHGHPIQPDSDMLIEKAKSVMEEYKCNKIFLGTEDKNIMRAFMKEFGEACVMNRKEYVDYRGGGNFNM